MSETYENSKFYCLYQTFEALAAEAESIDALNDIYRSIREEWLNQRSKLVYVKIDGYDCTNVPMCMFETKMFTDITNAYEKHRWRLMM